MQPDRPPPPDPWDADLSAVRSAVDDLAVWLAIWQTRSEPDAHARRCASDAIGAIDAALGGLHSIRARLIDEIRQADDDTAARVDELLARTRDGPQGHHSLGTAAPLDLAATQTPKSASRVTFGAGGGRAPREAL
jgi:hypothetical protein